MICGERAGIDCLLKCSHESFIWIFLRLRIYLPLEY